MIRRIFSPVTRQSAMMLIAMAFALLSLLGMVSVVVAHVLRLRYG